MEREPRSQSPAKTVPRSATEKNVDHEKRQPEPTRSHSCKGAGPLSGTRCNPAVGPRDAETRTHPHLSAANYGGVDNSVPNKSEKNAPTCDERAPGARTALPGQAQTLDFSR